MKAHFRSDITLKGLLSKFIWPTGTDHSLQRLTVSRQITLKWTIQCSSKCSFFLGSSVTQSCTVFQASLEVIPADYMMLAIALPLEQSQAAPSPQPVPLGDAKASGSHLQWRQALPAQGENACCVLLKKGQNLKKKNTRKCECSFCLTIQICLSLLSGKNNNNN